MELNGKTLIEWTIQSALESNLIDTTLISTDDNDIIELVKKYDHVISSDLQHWLNYVNMSEDEFWNIADSFRDHRVWWIENNKWMKRDIDGVVRSYGNIALNESQKNNFLVRNILKCGFVDSFFINEPEFFLSVFLPRPSASYLIRNLWKIIKRPGHE